ncbi:C-X-C chemokine receptor type 4-like [Limanda limanda]|uniref:C-X-C chemokine receptor type 4-like n=1 Tax=Limanda limanda TaxID=27771 RepID=UPI0029C662BB|nr:C-X-C chemokine receptor type 4-like [Limanda limanda]
MSYYEKIFIDDNDLNDTSSDSGFGSGELDVDLDGPCKVEHLMTTDLQRVFLPVVYALIFILGITGNGLVVVVLGCQRRSKCSLTDRYRLHLSAADLLFILVLPFWAVDSALADWRFGEATCIGVHVIYTVNLYGSVLILACISLDRYLAVVRSTDTNTRGLRHLLAHRLVFVGAWLPAGLLAVPDLIFTRTLEGGEGGTLCQRFYPVDKTPLWVAVFNLQLVLVGLIIPGLVLLVCYCVIVTRLTRRPLGRQRQKRRAVRTTIALVLCFFVCWLPYGAGISVDALLLLEVLPRSCRLEAVLGVWLTVAEPMAFAHCCLNPLLYAFLGAGFKSSAHRTLTLSRASTLKTTKKTQRTPSFLARPEIVVGATVIAHYFGPDDGACSLLVKTAEDATLTFKAVVDEGRFSCTEYLDSEYLEVGKVTFVARPFPTLGEWCRGRILTMEEEDNLKMDIPPGLPWSRVPQGNRSENIT